MSRYRRVNIDGKSLYKTETRKAAVALLPGTFAVINGDEEFAQAAAVVGRIYVIDVATYQGLGIRDAVPADSSAIGNYVEEGREMAVLMAAGTYVKDQPVTVGSNGRAQASTTNVVGYIQDTVTTTEPDFIRVRFRVGADQT